MVTSGDSKLCRNREVLRDWLKTQAQADCRLETGEVGLLLLFTGSPAVDADPLLAAGFQLKPDSSPASVLRCRVAAHLAAAALATEGDKESPLYWFRTLLLHPGALKGSWWPTMAEDGLKVGAG